MHRFDHADKEHNLQNRKVKSPLAAYRCQRLFSFGKNYDISLISIAKYGILWYNLITKRKYKRGTGFMNTKYVFEINPDVDMTSIRDSMLLDIDIMEQYEKCEVS